jgi:aspartate aminotransferase
MTDQPISARVQALAEAMHPFIRFFAHSAYARKAGTAGVKDFTVGNPHELPLPGLVAALQRAAVPQDESWFAYKASEPRSQQIVAASLRAWRGIPFEPADIALTNAGFGALAIGLKAVTDPGDEVIFSRPPWFFYQLLCVEAGLVPVKVDTRPETFDLDLEAIAAAITRRTRVVIVNTPNNPTGRIYPPETLTALASLLDEASRRNGRPVYILADEPYSRIVIDGRAFHSPTAYYPNTLLAYSYGKVLLAPGQRIGFLALPPTMPAREELRRNIMLVQFAGAHLWPNALLQHALAELDRLSIDLEHLQRKRDRLVQALREMGYQLQSPEGTFYLLPKSPWADDVAFAELLGEHDILVLPGSVAEIPGYFRLSLTASDAMIDGALPGFAAAIAYARAHEPRAAALTGVESTARSADP